MVDGFVRRYDTETGIDGLPGGEGAFLPCTCWLADCLALQGKRSRGSGALRARSGDPQRRRAPLRGVRHATGAPRRQLPAGLLPRVPDRHRPQPVARPDRSGGAPPQAAASSAAAAHLGAPGPRDGQPRGAPRAPGRGRDPARFRRHAGADRVPSGGRRAAARGRDDARLARAAGTRGRRDHRAPGVLRASGPAGARARGDRGLRRRGGGAARRRGDPCA